MSLDWKRHGIEGSLMNDRYSKALNCNGKHGEPDALPLHRDLNNVITTMYKADEGQVHGKWRGMIVSASRWISKRN